MIAILGVYLPNFTFLSYLEFSNSRTNEISIVICRNLNISTRIYTMNVLAYWKGYLMKSWGTDEVQSASA